MAVNVMACPAFAGEQEEVNTVGPSGGRRVDRALQALPSTQSTWDRAANLQIKSVLLSGRRKMSLNFSGRHGSHWVGSRALHRMTWKIMLLPGL